MATMRDVSSNAPPDPAPLFRLVRRTRALLRSSWLVTGIALTAGLMLTTLFLVTAADLLVPLPSALRLTALLLVAVPAAWAFLAGVLRPALRRLPPVAVARRIETHIPGMHSRLVSCIDLAGKGAEESPSPVFFRRLLTEAIQRVRGFRARRVVDFLSLRRAAAFALLGSLSFGLLWFVFSERVPTALARILQPFEDIPPKTGVEYTISPGTTCVLRGEDIVFTAHVEKGEPEKLWAELYSDSGAATLKHDLQKGKNADWKVTLAGPLPAGFEDGFTYRIFGGGTWSKKNRITLVERPRIVAQHTVLHFPEYMALPPRVDPPQATEVTGPEGSEVEVIVQSEGQVAEGEVQILEPRRRNPAIKERPDRLWFDDRLPPGAQTDGTWQWDGEKHGRLTHTEPAALGTHGHWFQDTPAGFPVAKGETLFTYVFLVPEQKPEALMVQWHDGTGWEHRAYWGADVLHIGKANTPGCRAMGPLPVAGEWVRLEVPADLVDLGGKNLHGMSFTLSGGQAYWHSAGVEELELSPVRTFAMKQTGDNEWSGRFPLTGSGLFRPELRNSLGHPNPTKKEAKYVALPDNAPQIVLERPTADIVRSEPGVVPLVLAAFDDYGLAGIDILQRRGDKTEAERRSVRKYDSPQRSDNVAYGLDLAALKMQTGDTLHYRLEARDRKGQKALTPELAVRIAPDPNADDKQLDAFEKTQDPFREKLANLIAEQAKVREAVEKLEAKYAPLAEKIEAAKAEMQAAPQGAPKVNDPAKPMTAPPLKLDPQSAKELAELQQQLAQLAAKEQQNAQLAQQIAGDLDKSAQQAGGLQMIPKPVLEQMQALQRAFQQNALQPLQDLASKMSQGADPKAGTPDLKGMKDQGNRLQKELEALRAKMEALANARKGLRDNLDEAISKLKEEMDKQTAGLTARELEELKKHLDALMAELKKAQGKEKDLADETGKAPDEKLPDLEKKQIDLEKLLADLFKKTKDLQMSEKMKRMKRRPDVPDQPYDPEAQGEKPVRPKEEDPDEPEKKNAKNDPSKPNTEKKDKPDDEDDEKFFMPALNGPKEKTDPRYDKKKRPVAKKPKEGGNPQEERQDLQGRQQEQMQNAEAAQKSLQSDAQALEQLLQQLQRAMNGEKGESLSQMMQSDLMRQAMAMAQRARQQGRAQGQKPGQQPGQPMPPSTQPTTGDLHGTPPTGTPQEAELAKLDPATRTVILKMPPRVREELLQGMKEEGPEGYRKFIQEYFKKLTEVKGPK
jgi:hypothetical protein